MTHTQIGESDMEFPHIPEHNQNSGMYQKAEQLWAQADEALDRALQHVRELEPRVYAMAPGNSDVSVLFDFLKGYIMQGEIEAQATGMGELAHQATMLLAASAITRLIRQEDRMRVDNVLAQLEKENDK